MSRFCLYNTSLLVEFLHAFFTISPIARNSQEFILWVAFCCSTRASNIIKSIPSSIRVFVAIEAIDILLAIWLIEFVAGGSICLGVKQNNIMQASHMQNSALRGITMGTRALPYNLVAELVRGKYGIEDDLEI